MTRSSQRESDDCASRSCPAGTTAAKSSAAEVWFCSTSGSCVLINTFDRRSSRSAVKKTKKKKKKEGWIRISLSLQTKTYILWLKGWNSACLAQREKCVCPQRMCPVWEELIQVLEVCCHLLMVVPTKHRHLCNLCDSSFRLSCHIL